MFANFQPLFVCFKRVLVRSILEISHILLQFYYIKFQVFYMEIFILYI